MLAIDEAGRARYAEFFDDGSDALAAVNYRHGAYLATSGEPENETQSNTLSQSFRCKAEGQGSLEADITYAAGQSILSAAVEIACMACDATTGEVDPTTGGEPDPSSSTGDETPVNGSDDTTGTSGGVCEHESCHLDPTGDCAGPDSKLGEGCLFPYNGGESVDDVSVMQALECG